jgi:hypothetical protein
VKGMHMDKKIEEIMSAVREYCWDVDDYLEMLKDLEVEGFEDEYFNVYIGVRDLLDKKLEKKIREILEPHEEKCECISCEDEE